MQGNQNCKSNIYMSTVFATLHAEMRVMDYLEGGEEDRGVAEGVVLPELGVDVSGVIGIEPPIRSS